MKNKKPRYAPLDWHVDASWPPLWVAATPSGVKVTVAWGFTDYGDQKTAIAQHPWNAKDAYFDLDLAWALLAVVDGKQTVRRAEREVFKRHPSFWMTSEEYTAQKKADKDALDDWLST